MDDESEWMTYADAIASLQKKGVGYVDANEYLTRRAAAGLIDTRAGLMIDGVGVDAVRSENAPVPAEFWQAFLGGQNLANHPQHGDFSASLPKPYPRRIVQLFGVRVERGKAPTIVEAAVKNAIIASCRPRDEVSGPPCRPDAGNQLHGGNKPGAKPVQWLPDLERVYMKTLQKWKTAENYAWPADSMFEQAVADSFGVDPNANTLKARRRDLDRVHGRVERYYRP